MNRKFKKIIVNLKSFLSYYGGRIKLPYFAPLVFVELTNICNFKCSFCPQYRNLNGAPRGFMELELYKEILEQIKEFTFRVVLHLGGEPLLYPQLSQMISLAKNSRLYVSLHTNGSLLNRERAEELLNTGLDLIVFSFNGGEMQEDYERVSPKNTYLKVIENVKTFLYLRNKKGLTKPYVALCVVKLFDGKRFLIDEKFKGFFGDFPPNEISGYYAHHWAGDFKDVIPLQFERPLAYYFPCQHLWQELAICWDGTIVACCNDIERNFILGDVKKDNLVDIWNSERMLWLREKLVKKEYKEVKLCQNCDRLFDPKIENNLIKKVVKKTVIWFGRRF